MLPSLREKKRYLAFEIISQNKIEKYSEINKVVWKACLDFLGELGTSKAGIIVLSDMWNPKKQRGMVRVNRRYLDHVKVALATVKKINGEKAIIRSVGASGVIGKAEKRYIA